jgi:hypothetical protein
MREQACGSNPVDLPCYRAKADGSSCRSSRTSPPAEQKAAGLAENDVADGAKPGKVAGLGSRYWRGGGGRDPAA